MPRYLLLALNGPTGGEGDEEALNRWYEESHLPGFKAVPGVKTARRYKVMRGNIPGAELQPYVAVYEIETDDIASVSAEFAKNLQEFHPTLDRSRSGHIMAIQVQGDE